MHWLKCIQGNTIHGKSLFTRVYFAFFSGAYIYTRYTDRKCSGNNIVSSLSLTLEECKQLCDADSQCVGFMFLDGGICTPKSICDVNSFDIINWGSTYIKQCKFASNNYFVECYNLYQTKSNQRSLCIN